MESSTHTCVHFWEQPSWWASIMTWTQLGHAWMIDTILKMNITISSSIRYRKAFFSCFIIIIIIRKSGSKCSTGHKTHISWQNKLYWVSYNRPEDISAFRLLLPNCIRSAMQYSRRCCTNNHTALRFVVWSSLHLGEDWKEPESCD